MIYKSGEGALGKTSCKKQEIGNIFGPVLKRNGITQKGAAGETRKTKFYEYLQDVLCIRSLFHSSFFESTFPPNWFHFSPAKISDIFFLHSKNLKPRLSLENELRSKRELGAGLLFSEVQDEIRRFCAFLFISTPFLEF